MGRGGDSSGETLETGPCPSLVGLWRGAVRIRHQRGPSGQAGPSDADLPRSHWTGWARGDSAPAATASCGCGLPPALQGGGTRGPAGCGQPFRAGALEAVCVLFVAADSCCF